MAEMKRDFKKMRQMHAPDGDHNSNWAISYGDMITLLLAFFVLFFHIGTDSFQVKMIEKEISESFTPPAERKPDSVWGQAAKAEDSPILFQQKDPIDDIETTVKGDKLIVEFPSVSFFQRAQFELTEEGTRVLQKFASIFKNKIDGYRLVVRGYTDNKPVKNPRNGLFKDNLELSMLRSVSAVRVLSNAGIPLRLIRSGGYGETDKGEILTPDEQAKLDRKIVLVLEPLDKTERGIANLEKEGGSQ